MRKIYPAIALSAIAAFAAPFSVNTGTAAWQVSQTAGTLNNSTIALNTPVAAAVLTGGLPIFPGGWIAPPGGSAWVGQNASDGNYVTAACTGTMTPNAGCGAKPGTYEYSLAFSIGGGGGNVNFSFTGDNLVSLTVFQNNVSIFTQASGNGSSAHTALYNTGNIVLAAGASVRIVATLVNDPFSPGDTTRNPSGFLVSGVGDSSDVPEPSTYAMLGLGAVAVGVVRLRRN